MNKKIIVAVILVFLTILLVEYPVQATSFEVSLDVDDCGEILDVFPDADAGVYILSSFDNSYKITSVEGDSVNSTLLDIPVDSSSFAYLSRKFYFFVRHSDEYDRSAVRVFIYDCRYDMLSERVINTEVTELCGTSALDSQNNYYLANKNIVQIYSNNFKLVKKLELSQSPQMLCSSGYDDIVFCILDSCLHIINGMNITATNIIADKIQVGLDGCFSTDKGEVYRMDGDTPILLYNGFTGNSGVSPAGDYIFGIRNGSLVSVHDNKEVSCFSASNTAFVTVTADKCITVEQKENNAEVKLLELSSLQELFVDDSTVDTSQINIYSDTIKGISPGCTVSELKSLFGGRQIVVYGDSGIKSNGTIGTGNRIEFASSERSPIYTIVYGELTGEGNINSRDKQVLAKHLLEECLLTGYYLEAADINADGKVTLSDFVLLDNYIEGKYSIEQNRP